LRNNAMKESKKLLLIDDDVDFLDMNKTVLENNGYTVLTAHSAKEGMDKVKAEIPDLIVLDLMMEKFDSGFSFAKELKSNPLFKHIPILMLTAVADKTGFRFSKELDGYWMRTDDYAEKPIVPSELLKRVKNLFDKAEKGE